MEDQVNEVFFIVIGVIMFLMAVTLLLEYQRYFYHAYENLYQLTENEYAVPVSAGFEEKKIE